MSYTRWFALPKGADKSRCTGGAHRTPVCQCKMRHGLSPDTPDRVRARLNAAGWTDGTGKGRPWVTVNGRPA